MGGKENRSFLEIDFTNLMDLRVDYAFKLVFGSGETVFLISLLNAIFASKKIPRAVKSVEVLNPYLEKRSKEDKHSILDIKARLEDGSVILIEMHLYGMLDLKYKTLRSWARVYGEELKPGEKYSAQPPVICVAFADGSFESDGRRKIHKCCKITDIDDGEVFTDALELHYIDMKAFAEATNKAGGIEKGGAQGSMLANWLAFITEKDIADKSIIKGICEEQEEIGMAVSTLARFSEDKLTRHEYLRRQDDIMLAVKNELEYKMMERRAEQERARAEQERARADAAETALDEKDAIIAMLKARLGEK